MIAIPRAPFWVTMLMEMKITKDGIVVIAMTHAIGVSNIQVLFGILISSQLILGICHSIA